MLCCLLSICVLKQRILDKFNGILKIKGKRSISGWSVRYLFEKISLISNELRFWSGKSNAQKRHQRNEKKKLTRYEFYTTWTTIFCTEFVTETYVTTTRSVEVKCTEERKKMKWNIWSRATQNLWYNIKSILLLQLQIG